MDLYNDFLTLHQPQLELTRIPSLFWPKIWEKLKNQSFDGGLYFNIAQIDYENSNKSPKDPVYKLFVSAEDGLSPEDPNNIFLIDHAWTYDVNGARDHLCKVPGLLERMCQIMGYNSTDKTKENKIEFVLREMWRYNQFFTVNSGKLEERLPLWYIMDELGCAINHSDSPNFRSVAFLHLTEGITYSLLFPIKSIDYNEEVTRDYVENQASDQILRKALLLPWIDEDFTKEDFVQIEPDTDYFSSGRQQETLPILNTELSDKLKANGIEEPGKLKVFTEYEYVRDYLTDPAFEVVEDEASADILWLLTHFKDYKALSIVSPRVFVNQFPFESVLTVKDLLSIICRRKSDKTHDPETLQTYPTWLPTTYNLTTELVKFVSYYQHREAKGLENYWICKPWNLARGLDTHCTNNLNHILRLPCTGPKIVQKYVSKPVLYERPEIGAVKFDIRYVILLSSVKPLKAYVYSNFFLRFANRAFALDKFDVYEQHFTVMNYSEEAPLHHLKCADFIEEWNKMYPDFTWGKVEPKILRMIWDVLEAAAAEEPPKGIAHNPQSRAVYAMDCMLEWFNNEMEPVLLEINFSPDNKRACEYYPQFYNDIFQCLFLDNVDKDVFHDLSIL